ncbi:hypothetical protein [Sphingobium algorifonticola]|uniref:hypothetical protein n=1 Tax=Sphingobium algorifonticola TaxID=2008318 RepID=UPI0030B9F707
MQAATAEPRRRGRPPRQPQPQSQPQPQPLAQIEDADTTREDDDGIATVSADAPVAKDAERPRRGLRQRRPREEDSGDEPTGLDLAVLPPAIARADNDSEEAEVAEAPRKRPRARRPAATEAAE